MGRTLRRCHEELSCSGPVPDLLVRLACCLVATADEPPRGGDDPAPSGEVASLEVVAQRHVTALAASSLVGNKARVFLEEIAFRCLDRPFPVSLAQAAAEHRLDDSARCGPLQRLLVDVGVVARDDDKVRFVPDAVGDYLAAYHVFRRHPGGPTLMHPHHRFLKPRAMWPWQDSETALFLVALWWPGAETVTRKKLDNLLGRKHCDPNVHFVAALLHRGLVCADDLRGRTLEILHGHLDDGVRKIGLWRTTVTTLYLLEPQQAVDGLERLVQFPNRTVSPRRRFDAVDELTEHDPQRGGRNLRLLAETLTGTPRERLDVAVLIRDRDTELGDRLIRSLVDARDMGDLRAGAARLTGDHTLWARLVGDGCGVSDTARLTLLAELADADPTLTVAAAERFVDTANDETTPLKIARTIRGPAPEVALRIAGEVAWPTRRRFTGPVRLDAVRLIGELVPTRLVPDLDRLSRDDTAGVETRLEAAGEIVERGGPVTALCDFAMDPRVDRDHRGLAARKVATVNRELGGRVLVFIAQSYGPTDPDQLMLLRDAHALAPAPAAEALRDIVQDGQRPGSFRMRAVELGVFTKAEAIGHYRVIATTTADKDDAYEAARRVVGMHQDIGEQLMACLAMRFAADQVFQLGLAQEAGIHGTSVLNQLALHAWSIELRLNAADTLLPSNQKLAYVALDKIVKTRGAGGIRIDAACRFPVDQALEALRYIVYDQDHEDVRFMAGVRAMEINEPYGRQLLLALAQDPGISPRTRDNIHKILSL